MSRIFEKITWIFWIGLVVTLPITSMPIVAKLVHSSAVAPTSLIFLILLCFTWLPFYLFKKGTFPVQAKAVLCFLIVGFVSTGASFFLDTPAYKNETLLSNIVSGLVTLCMGVLFYLLSTVLPRDNEKIRKTLLAINWGGGIMLVWDILVSIITFLSPNDTPQYLRAVQHLFSTTTFFGIRSVGFAAEPSWLAHILNMVYLPYWLAATVSQFTAHKKKLGKITLENVLLFVGFLVLFKTLSRAGLGSFILALGVFFVKFNIWAIKRIGQRWSSGTSRNLVTTLVAFAVVGIYVGGTIGCVFLLSKIDPRMEKVFSLKIIKEEGIAKYADTLQFGERFTYWQAGWRTFNAYPLLGVGVGNAGFYFSQMLPDGAWNLTEVRNFIYRTPGLLNVKSMWSRVLAETGIVGFSFFLLILVFTGITASQLTHSSNLQKKAIGWMGICMLVSFIIEGFSVDSFALPYLWFTLGLVAATWRWTKTEKIED
ncbi:MAG: O-antigen ligase family protein [Anaerolineaceae bacterium]